MKIKLILLMCFCVCICLSCSNAGALQPSGDEDDQTEQIIEDGTDESGNEDDQTDQNLDDGTNESVWFARLKLKPQADANYRVTEDPEMMDLVLKHDVMITQSWRWPTSSDPELLLYYDLLETTKYFREERRENFMKDILSTGKFEVVYYNEETWSVRLKLKPQADKSYRATKDPEIMAVVLKNDLRIWQLYSDQTKIPTELYQDMVLYYNVTGLYNKSQESRENIINVFLSTGKFEDEVYEYEMVRPL